MRHLSARHFLDLIVPLAILGAVAGPGCSSSGSSGGTSDDAGADQSASDSSAADDVTTPGHEAGPDQSAGDSGTGDESGGGGEAGTTDGPGADSASEGGTSGGEGGITDAGSDVVEAAAVSTCTGSTLHPGSTSNSLYCPFSAVGDGGSNDYCDPSVEHCCDFGSPGSSSCEATGTACGAGGVDWACADPATDCPASHPVCCAPGASIVLGSGTACTNSASSMTSTACVVAGGCTGIQVCTSTAECPAGMTCTPFRQAGNDVGGCM
jgi:hypothetical protein